MSNEIKDWVLVPREPDGDMLDAAIDANRGFGGEDDVDAAWAAMIKAAPTPPAESQAVASLREMLELREATQNGRVTDKPELDIVRDARAALSAQPRPSSVDRWGIPPCVECGAVDATDAETKCHCSGDKDDCHGVALWPDGDTQPASAPVGVEAVASHMEAFVAKWKTCSMAELASYSKMLREALTQQPAATLPDEDDSDLTVAYMAGRHDGRGDVERLVEAARSVVNACSEHYGNGMGLHLALTGKRGLGEKLDAAIAPFTATQQDGDGNG